MTQVARSFVRTDEKQHVFIVGSVETGFAIVETAELWEEPRSEGEAIVFHYYPTVFMARRYATEAHAVDVVNERYPWTAET